MRFIVDHDAEPGCGTRETKNLHRIDPAIITERINHAS